MASSDFRIGDLVFAKVRGYKPWPARIDHLHTTVKGSPQYEVFFFGTYERGFVGPKYLYSFEDHEAELGAPKTTKKKFEFENGMREIRTNPKLTYEDVKKGCVPRRPHRPLSSVNSPASSRNQPGQNQQQGRPPRARTADARRNSVKQMMPRQKQQSEMATAGARKYESYKLDYLDEEDAPDSDFDENNNALRPVPAWAVDAALQKRLCLKMIDPKLRAVKSTAFPKLPNPTADQLFEGIPHRKVTRRDDSAIWEDSSDEM